MKFVKSSFIPDRKINLALVDGRITNSMIKNLHDINVNIIKSEKCKETYEAISYHPDINLIKLNDENILVIYMTIIMKYSHLSVLIYLQVTQLLKINILIMWLTMQLSLAIKLFIILITQIKNYYNLLKKTTLQKFMLSKVIVSALLV